MTKSLKNFRWNESPLLMLNRLEDIGRAQPTEAVDARTAHQPVRFHVAVGGCLGKTSDQRAKDSAADPHPRLGCAGR
jgi:hypothetical protein